MCKLYMTWETFKNDIEEFKAVLRKEKFIEDSVILAIKRGGYTTSVTLSNQLNIPVSSVSFQTRDNNDNEPKFLEPDLIHNATKVIIPDDIYDSGLTIEKIINKLTNHFNIKIENIIGLFHFKTNNIINSSLQKYKYMRDNENKWCVMPWE